MQEGDSITVLCIALGTPTPTVTLYVAGHPIRSTTSRHMVTTLHNVTRLMSEDHSWIKRHIFRLLQGGPITRSLY